MIKAIALLGEYTPTFPPHSLTNAAIKHAQNLLDVDINADWVSTEDIDPKLFERYSGLWIAPGSPYKTWIRHCGRSVTPEKTKSLALAPAAGFSICCRFTVNSTLFAVPAYERFGFQIQGECVEAKGIAFTPMKLPCSHGQS